MLSRLRFPSLTLFFPASAHSAEPFVETFEAKFESTRFSTPIPNQNNEVRDGVLWTRGPIGGKFPPMVCPPVEGKDLSLSFRCHHFGPGGWHWFFVDRDDGCDGFGCVDQMLRLKRFWMQNSGKKGIEIDHIRVESRSSKLTASPSSPDNWRCP